MTTRSISALPISTDPVAPQREPLIPSNILGMLMFVGAEIMVFAGLVSAYTVYRASTAVWPPPDQPRLPLEETALNTAALLASGVVLYFASRLFRRGERARANRWLLVSILLGAFFVVYQGAEWVALISEGLTLKSSNLGAFFYLIIGLHALHAIVALGLLVYAWVRLRSGFLSPAFLGVTEVFWYFVVGVWPVLYLRVYL